ncbi:MAG TPA: hypothetical protein DCO67_03125 [Staphylococcus sp.]|nr:hypothetical protein [Staphylococcus sp.]
MIELRNKGWTYKEIGKEFKLSRHTVSIKIKDYMEESK